MKRPAVWIALAVILIGLIIAIASNNEKSNGNASVSTTSTTQAATRAPAAQPPVTATQPPATTTPMAIQTLFRQNGSGISTTPYFTVPSAAKGWLIHYLFNCASKGSPGNFRLYVKDSSGSPADVAANQLAMSGGNTYYNYTPGNYQLEINSGCAWTVVVQTIPK